MNLPEISMESVDGRVLRTARWKAKRANGTNLPILFFNGIGANLELIQPLADLIAERDILTFDMPGIGGSPEPTFPYRPWMIARIADLMLDRFGYDQCDVMGISWGGAMAQQFAIQFGPRVNKLILVATTAGMLMVPGKFASLSKMADPRRYIDPDFMRTNFKVIYGGVDEGASGHIERIKPPSTRGYLYQLGAMMGWTSAPFLPFVKAPTLIMMGDKDNIVPLINGRFLASLIPDSRLEVINGGGHLFLVAHARNCAAMISAFLDEEAAGLQKAA